MENNYFENIRKIIHEYDELVKFKNDLEKDTKIGIVFKDIQPGLNYKIYSDEVKFLIWKFIDKHLDEIKKQFN